VEDRLVESKNLPAEIRGLMPKNNVQQACHQTAYLLVRPCSRSRFLHIMISC
jgi:hypothetical protein